MKKDKATNIISVPITWISGGILFKPESKWAKAYYGICHYGDCVFTVTPIDFPKPLTLTTIKVAPVENYCEKECSCLNFKCKLNKFNKHSYAEEFKDLGTFSLGLPTKVANKEEDPWWCEEPRYSKWKDFKIMQDGGKLEYNPLWKFNSKGGSLLK